MQPIGGCRGRLLWGLPLSPILLPSEQRFRTMKSTLPSRGRFLVAVSGNVVFARVLGLATMQNSVSFKEFLERVQEEGYRKFVLDLDECPGFDSTFMGILLGLALRQGSVVLVNVKAPLRKLLEDVGIHCVVTICEHAMPFPEAAMQELDLKVDGGSWVRHVLAAHESLVRHDRRNEAKFGAFLDDLRRELGEGSPF